MLLRRAEANRLMVVLSGRPPESDEPQQAARIRRAVSYLPLQELDLEPLSEAESEELLSGVLHGHRRVPGAPERRAILRTAAGNPMAIEFLTQDWIQNPDNPLAVTLTAMSSDVPRAAFEAVEYDQVIDRMLPELTPRHRIAMYLAAILGPRLNDLEYFEVLQLSPAQTMAALSEMLERRLLRSTERGLEFTNEVARARIYLKAPQATRVKLHDAVASKLLEAIGNGGEIPDLEIAWHCIRARRSEEATEFLLGAARNSITHGAPDEAARALSSAIPHLKGATRASAIVLLGETYQEMANWKEALQCLDQLTESDMTEPDILDSAKTLAVASRWSMGSFDRMDFEEIFNDLLAIVQRSPSVIPRIRATRVAALLAADMRSDKHSRILRTALTSLAPQVNDVMQLSKLCLSQAMTYYHVRDEDNGLSCAVRAAKLCEEAEATDSTFASIHTGIGSILAAGGQYLRGIAYLEKAYRCASRLDNAALMSQTAGNLALCFSREGLLDDSWRWAGKAWQHALATPMGSYDRVHAASQGCLSAIAAGDKTATEEALARLEVEGGRANQPWVQQAALLFLADGYYLMNRFDSAFDAIRKARQLSRTAISIGFAGMFVRWSTQLFLREGRASEVWAELREYYEILDRLDLIDRAEILASFALLASIEPIPIANPETQAREVLSRLPAACSHRLARFGLTLNARTNGSLPKNSFET